MTKPTPEAIATALKMLPPRPDAGIILGDGEDERYGEMEVFKDILAYGHVRGPREEAEAAAAAGTVGRWEHAWRSGPLVIHDTGLVGAIGAMAPDLIHVSENMSTVAIGDVLEEHPGPVACLRIESPSGCPSPEAVEKWMARLRAKGEDGLHELTMVNTNLPKNEVFFPLRRLPSGLRSLSLCFFTLHPLDAGHLADLAELRLTDCDLCGQELSAVIPELYCLRTLVLGYCRLTTGCGPDGLRILSTNLRRLHMWNCTASGGVALEYTPRLQCLCTGVRPLDRDTTLLIDRRTPCTLGELHGLMLYFHDLSFLSHMDAKLNGRRIAPLPNLCILTVCVEMSTPLQLLDLLDLLIHIPHLKHLTLMRVDEAHQNEEFSGNEEAFGAPCIRYSLRRLTLDHFRAGAIEIAFAIRILAKATALASLELKPDTALTQTQASHACALFLNCRLASPECAIQLFE